ADRGAVEAERREFLHAAGSEVARIDLDRAFGVRLEIKLGVERIGERAHFRRREEGRRAAAEMQLRDAPRTTEQRSGLRQFPREVLDILCRAPVIARNDL